MLAFPAAPTDGDKYRAEGGMWTWNAASSRWVGSASAGANLDFVPSAGGAMTGDLTVPGGALAAPNNAEVENYAELHDATGEYSWTITGKKLECWGVVLCAGGAAATTVTLPKTYANTNYTLIGNYDQLGVQPALWSIYVSPLSANTFRAGVNNTTFLSPQRAFIAFHSIGEWDGIS